MRECDHLNLSKKVQCDFDRLKVGLAYHEDLVEKPITYEESQVIFDQLKRFILEVNSECLVELMGGFRRFKLYSIIKILNINSSCFYLKKKANWSRS